MKIQPTELGLHSSAVDKPQNLKEWEGGETDEEVDEEDDEVL